MPADPAVNIFYPMNEFYESSGAPLPQLDQVQVPDIPEPYRSLLVHDRDMTSTLTEAYQREMRLRILRRVLDRSVFAREIVLEVEDSGKTAVFAAIKIYLNLFPLEAKRLILEGKQPFGAILHRQRITHISRPNTFFQVIADETISHALSLTDHPLTGHIMLYGRQSTLLNTSENPLARVLRYCRHPSHEESRCLGISC